jgi:TorA maturation chaperone TorD
MHTLTAPDVDAALARSILYDAAAIAWAAPEPGRLARLAGPHGGDALALAAGAAWPAFPDGVRDAALALCAAAAGARNPIVDAYAELFGHTTRGLACPYETEYGAGDTMRQPHELADIAGYYRAFGLVLKEALDTRVDHVACECEFVAVLHRKEAVMLALGAERGGGDAAETVEATRGAVRSFLRRHLARFGIAFARAVAGAGPHPFYAAAASLLELVLRSDCSRLGIPVGPVFMELRPEVDDAPAACGGGGSFIPLDALRGGS